MVILKLIDVWWPISFDDLINVTLNQMIYILVFSFILGVIFHFSFSKKSNIENNEDILTIKNFSLKTKILTTFIILVVIFIPIFKLLKTSYFL